MKSSRSTPSPAFIAGRDAQVEVKPQQGPLVGSGARVSRGSTARYYELESKFENVLMEWIAKRGIKLANTFCNKLRTYEGQNKQIGLLEAE